MELNDYRGQLDKIDGELLKLFTQRMDIAAEIAAWKKENHMPVLDLRREKEKLRTLEEQSPEELKEYTASLFSLIMELSARSRDHLNRRALIIFFSGCFRVFLRLFSGCFVLFLFGPAVVCLICRQYAGKRQGRFPRRVFTFIRAGLPADSRSCPAAGGCQTQDQQQCELRSFLYPHSCKHIQYFR